MTSPFARTVRGSGPGLALAHGAGGGVAPNYGAILDGLAEHRTVVGVDYPGTGDTPRSGRPLELDELADQLVAAAVDEGLGTFAVAGYSLGGAVAVRAAVRHPERVTSLVLTAAFARPDNHMRLTLNTWATLLEHEDRGRLADFLLPTALSPAALEALSEEELRGALAGTAATVPPGTPEHVDLVGRVDVRGDLAGISVPTLVVVTTADRLVPPGAQRRLAAGIPGARVAELDTGHLPFAERPEEWRKLIADFLATADGPAGRTE
ncbi:alpha/beta fold hydrolase [Actinomadura kijaniata]|uniref:alpha/beta fold hydrolase n=1 Tax=Actinomadura kijaniata TaxID=46161 RepID=UPI00082EBCE9|nr:alpha/beta fold hydrolase [Actinomadura kijaniata]